MHAHDRPAGSAARALRALALAVALFAVAWLLLGHVAVREHADRSDEPEWVAISILHTDQFLRGAAPAGAELDPPEWQGENPWRRGVQRTMFGYPNPCLPKLIFGTLLEARGFTEASPATFPVFERADPAAGARAKAELEPALPLARRVVLALACLSAVLLFFATRAALPGAWGTLAALFAYGLWFASPLVRDTATYVRTDYFMLPWVLGALLLALGAAPALSGERGIARQALAGLGLGLLCGLAVASKLNGALICVCTALWVPLAWLRVRARPGAASWRGPALALVLAGALAFALFYALDPILWGQPIAGVRDILARWSKNLAYFQDTWSKLTGVEVARTLPERFTLFADRTLARDDPWRAYTGLPGGFVLMLGGLLVLLVRALRPGSREVYGERGRSALLLAVYAVVFALGTALWLPLDWARFWIPVAPVVALLEAVALAWLVRGLFGGLRRLVGF